VTIQQRIPYWHQIIRDDMGPSVLDEAQLGMAFEAVRGGTISHLSVGSDVEKETWRVTVAQESTACSKTSPTS
jgi:hypothetical protein